MNPASGNPLDIGERRDPHLGPEEASDRLKTGLKRFAFPICLGLLAAFLAIEIAMLMLKHFGPIKDSIFRYD
jgi:hypothetical protein